MLASRTRRIAAIFLGGLSLASCGRGGGTSPMTPLAQSMQPAQQTKVTAARCKTLPLTDFESRLLDARSHQTVALSGCGIRGASREIASFPQAGNLQVFDVPGAINVSKCTSAELFNICGTTALSINASGTIVGYYLNSNNVNTAFVRTAGGDYTSFQAPGAGYGPFKGTYPSEITNAGAIAGLYADPQYLAHGFVRHKDGSFLTYEAPGASEGTFIQTINAGGDTAGYYYNAQGVPHAFLRHSNGSFVKIVPPGAARESVCQGDCLTNAGTVAGYYRDASGFQRGYVRSPG